MRLNKIIAICWILLCQNLTAQTITFDTWQNLTVQENMPAPVVLQHSNNNLDLVKFKERFYVAFRTAPTHFASSKSTIYVISSPDLKTWKYEYTIFRASDLREPRFAVLKDSLFLYCFRGGTKLFKFEPQEILVTTTAGDYRWTNTYNIGLDGFVPWRLRNRNDTLFLSAYYGKELYNNKHQSDLRLFTSQDGRAFTPISKAPQIDLQTAEEGEFIFDKNNDLYATVRLEGTGSLVCKADKDSIGKWNYKRYKYKFDSALLFNHEEDIYLVSRRNLDGNIDKNEESKKRHYSRMDNLIRYSSTRKKTALFKLDKEQLEMKPILDFPSTGDCSYPAIQQLNEHDYLLMNYSSDINKKEKNWIRGQLGKTYIYWTVLHMK
jgi:hypothetical protein